MEFKELDKILREIYRYYQEIRNGWMKCNDYQQINLSKKFVIDVMDSSRCPELLQVIFNHRAFLFENVVSISILLAIENCESRVKNQNSLESKLATYCGQNHENGEIALKKCVNDLYGIRYILKDNSDLLEIKNYVKNNFPKLKCIDSSNNDYKAIHVYFKEDNYDFPWELQIWNPEDEQSNKKSHEKYKQGYTTWESESIKEV